VGFVQAAAAAQAAIKENSGDRRKAWWLLTCWKPVWRMEAEKWARKQRM